MSTNAWEGATRAELYVRSDLPSPAGECRTTIVSRLDALVADGALAEYTVTSWAKRVPLDESSRAGRAERELYRRFDAWATDAGVRLAPSFDTRECYSWTTGERRTELVLPAACLALYEGDELVGVVPHADETGDVTIHEACDRLTANAEDDDRDDGNEDRGDEDRTVPMAAD